MTKLRKVANALGGIQRQEENNAPLLSIFAGIFGILLVLLVLINTLSEQAVRERLEQSEHAGVHRIQWAGGGGGYVVISFPNALRIIETGHGIATKNICQSNGHYTRYVQEVYNKKQSQLIFVILEGSVTTMAIARDCLIKLLPNRSINISWIMADDELLKSVALGDIPSYIDEHIKDVIPKP